MVYKKTLSLLLALLLLAGSVGVCAQDNAQHNMVNTLSRLEIMSGDPDGNLRLGDNVTRAEFTKVAIAASPYKNSVATHLTVSPFKDVPYTHWAAPYIKVAVTNKVVQGYPDSTFGPDNAVLYEEAITIALKLLGYTDADFGISWPYGQVGLAKNIGLCDNMATGVGDALTRSEVMTLAYNLLTTKTKSGNSTYVDTLGYKLVEDVILIASVKEDAGVGAGKINTSSGVYKISSDFNLDDVGKRGSLILKNSDEAVLFCPDNQDVEEYLVYSVKSNVIQAWVHGSIQEVEVDDSAAVYSKTQKTTMSSVRSSIRPGNSISLFKNSLGDLEYGLVRNTALDQAMVVYSPDWLGSIGMDNSAVLYKDGKQAVPNDIDINDMIYYSKRLNTIWAFSGKNSSYYTNVMGYKVVEDVIFQTSVNEYSSIGSDKIIAGGTAYKIRSDFDLSNVGRRGDLILNDSGEAVGFSPSNQTVEDYLIYSTLSGNLLVLRDGITQPINLVNSTTIYNKNTSTLYSSAIAQMQPGDSISLYKNAFGTVEYGLWRSNTLEGPITMKSGELQSLFGGNTANLTVIKDGKKAVVNGIATNDVIYYSKQLNTVWAYSTKKTGIYEKAAPSKDMPTSVTISGVSYDLESAAAFNALGPNGGFDYGDTVTVLLGKDGKIADVLQPDAANSVVYGYLIETGKKEYTNAQNYTYNSYYIKLAIADGSVYEYVTNSDYASYKNRVMKVTFTDGIAKATTVDRPNNLYGKVDASRYLIDDEVVAPNVKVMDVTGVNEMNQPANYVVTYLQRIDGLGLSSSNILHYERNSAGQIATLILNDVTGDCYQYGLVLTVENTQTSSRVSGSYTYDIGGVTSSLSTSNSAYSLSVGQGAKFVMNGTKVAGITSMEKISGSATDFTNTYIRGSNGNKYPLASDVAVYKRTRDYKYFYTPLEDAVSNPNISSVEAYYDKDPSYGGRVRVIIFSEK